MNNRVFAFVIAGIAVHTGANGFTGTNTEDSIRVDGNDSAVTTPTNLDVSRQLHLPYYQLFFQSEQGIRQALESAPTNGVDKYKDPSAG